MHIAICQVLTAVIYSAVVEDTTLTSITTCPTSATANFIGVVRLSASLATLRLKNIPANETVYIV